MHYDALRVNSSLRPWFDMRLGWASSVAQMCNHEIHGAILQRRSLPSTGSTYGGVIYKCLSVCRDSVNALARRLVVEPASVSPVRRLFAELQGAWAQAKPKAAGNNRPCNKQTHKRSESSDDPT
jgi:hypothetical protein